MLTTPRRSMALAVALLALSQALLAQAGVPLVRLDEVERYEGQTVRLEGVVRSLTMRPSGARLVLAAAGHAIEVLADGTSGVHAGSVVMVEGRLGRLGPDLVLFARQVEVGEPPPTASVPLAALATEPDKPVRVHGIVRDGRLHDGGASVALGDGPWPEAGRVEATVLPVFEADCACVRLHAHGVRAWTE